MPEEIRLSHHCECLPYAGHWARSFRTHLTYLRRGDCCYGHGTDEDTELRQVNNLPQVMQGSGRARVRTRGVCFQRPLSFSSLEAPCSPSTSPHHLTPCPWHLLRHSCAPRRSTDWHRRSMHTCPMGGRAKITFLHSLLALEADVAEATACFDRWGNQGT